MSAGAARDLLTVLSTTGGRRPGECFVLGHERVRLGRGSDNEITLDSGCIGRCHARLERRGDTWWIVDMRSANGTYVNDELIDRDRALRDGDRIVLGGVIFRYLHGDDVERRCEDERTRLAYFDPLTEIGNARLLRETVDSEVALARQHGHDLSVALFNVDHFKDLNNRHGHLAGDHVLRELARLLQARLADAGTLARGGGDSFALVVPEMEAAEVAALGDAAREEVAGHTFVFQGETIAITVSVGSSALAASDDSADEFLRRAEADFCATRRAGHHRVSR